jgi:hypothetical protein
MNFPRRPSSLAEVGQRILTGADAGAEVKDFLHEFQVAAGTTMLSARPPSLTGNVLHGDRLDAYLQALAVYLSARLNTDPPEWTHPVIVLPEPWFASSGPAIRNYLLLSSPAPFRMRNLFIDEDSLMVA